MTREVAGTLPMAEGETATFVPCDRYARPTIDAPVTVTVGAGGAFTATLNVTGTEKCYTVLTATEKKAFWVYEGTGVQSIDLTQPVYPRNAIEVYADAEPAEAAHNAARLVQGVVCGHPVISEEEQRFVCRYEDYAAGVEDKEMCAIDTGIGGLNG